MKKTYFVLHTDKADAVACLSNEQAGKLLKAMFEYNSDDSSLAFDDDVVKLAFTFFKASFDADAERYERICERRRAAGKKGGLAKQANASNCQQEVANGSKPSQIQTQTQIQTQIEDISTTPSSSKEDSEVVDVLTHCDEDLSLSSEKPKETTYTNPNRIPDCPFQKICDLYNQRFAGRLPAMKVASGKRRAIVKARWADIYKVCQCANVEEGLHCVDSYLIRISEEEWMFGKNDRGWVADFDYIFSARCYTRILENSRSA